MGVSGDAVFVIDRSADGAFAVVEAVAELFDTAGSPSDALTFAVLLIVPALFAVATRVIVAVPPLAMVPRLQVTVGEANAQLP